tara:strand:- start:1007 stop:1369 length:363 start_codon:yes stop_codon:yes gene_type:complete
MRSVLFVLALLITSQINASTIVLWKCELLDGKKIEEVKKINSLWVKTVNSLGEYKVKSHVLEPIISADMNEFRYLDIYESPIHWGQTRNEIENGVVASIDAQFDEVSKCNVTSLYESEES